MRAIVFPEKGYAEVWLNLKPPILKGDEVQLQTLYTGVDHAVPPDVSLDNFKYFVSLLKKLCGW